MSYTVAGKAARDYCTIANTLSAEAFCRQYSEDDKRATAFSVVAAAWLRYLGTIDPRKANGRIRASVMMGNKIEPRTLHWLLPERVNLGIYVGLNVKEFVCEMSLRHNTLQQDFTRLCREWVRFVSREWPINDIPDVMREYREMFIQVVEDMEAVPLPYI